MKYGHPTLVRYPVWVALQSDPTVQFLIKPMSYGEVYGANEYYYAKQHDTDITSHNRYGLLDKYILDSRGCVGFPTINSIVRSLSLEDKNFLELKLFQLSSLTVEQINNIERLLYTILEPSLQGSTFNCAKCKAIPGMQLSRNCPLISIPVPSNFKIRLGNETIKYCPINDIDNYVVNQAITAYTSYTNKLYPLDGGLESQSVWFVVVSQKYHVILEDIRNRKY